MDGLIKWIDKTLEQILITLMAIMVITVTWQVATRYLLNSPSSYTEELANYLLIWISLLGSVYAMRQKAHLGIDILVRRFPANLRRMSQHLIHAAIIIFALIVCIYGGSRLVYITLKLKQVSAAFQVPIGYIYTVLPLSGILFVFYAIYEMISPPPDA